jgi:DNA-binding CsgD family transcriptional regulator
VVILSQHADEDYAFELPRNGTAELAYLLKDRVDDTEELPRALRKVYAGRSVIDPTVVETLVARRARLADSPLAGLTARELDVLHAMAQGKTNPAIAERLVLSQSAVEEHVNAIFAKLGLSEEPKSTGVSPPSPRCCATAGSTSGPPIGLDRPVRPEEDAGFLPRRDGRSRPPPQVGSRSVQGEVGRRANDFHTPCRRRLRR